MLTYKALRSEDVESLFHYRMRVPPRNGRVCTWVREDSYNSWYNSKLIMFDLRLGFTFSKNDKILFLFIFSPFFRVFFFSFLFFLYLYIFLITWFVTFLSDCWCMCLFLSVPSDLQTLIYPCFCLVLSKEICPLDCLWGHTRLVEATQRWVCDLACRRRSLLWTSGQCPQWPVISRRIVEKAGGCSLASAMLEGRIFQKCHATLSCCLIVISCVRVHK